MVALSLHRCDRWGAGVHQLSEIREGNMNENRGTIAIAGASGQLGRRVVELLLEQVEPGRVLAITRHPDRLAGLAAQGVRVAAGDFAQPAALAQTLAGVERLLLISTDQVGPARVELHKNAIGAAQRAGVGHITYTSAINPSTSPLAFIREHGATEEAIQASGLPYTFLRNNLYTEILLRVAPQAIATGELRNAAGDGAIGFVSREDCARAAAAVLAAPAQERVVYEITGPAAVTYAAIARDLSTISGREVRYIPLSPEEAQQGLLAAGLPQPAAESLVAIDRAMAQGAFHVVSSAVYDLTGALPASVYETLARHRELLLAPQTGR
jgi:NAD(P)H dehydrogenase (quinone)